MAESTVSFRLPSGTDLIVKYSSPDAAVQMPQVAHLSWCDQDTMINDRIRAFNPSDILLLRPNTPSDRDIIKAINNARTQLQILKVEDAEMAQEERILFVLREAAARE